MRAQLARIDAVLVQALIAAALSFAHLHDVASAAGQDGWKAWAYPISVDLLLVAAWRRLRTGDAKAAGWCWFVIALTASLGANVATAGLLDLDQVPAWLRILVAGWPAVAFLGGTLLAHSAPGPVPHEDTEDEQDQEDAPDPAPELPTQPAPEPTPAPPAVAVPAALVEHARKVAAEHHTRTGTAIDTPTLRARLGVPAPMADAIAAHL
ncbi:SpdA protein [Streptomyces avermitilis]|uniref:Mobile element transfer protein SpdA n=2 Tax=Streptomyces avermitilis TaxID=33903 RepID=Q82H13_STRAW|nr:MULTISPECIES: DUF2637 domain-containing protein [Streptomyces]KUN56874.1 SpdA protein [Streptomyces avermitilis]MYS99330.1 DUF2637 domain-containing protein [Streptomyces sp. SID5469]OOV32396.1 SpdA protein [Streptomyces avermitilis]BAC71445.1 putative mobile element transfer protein SpdA [Streptomyces avermitilis MA-4680 = NBRC 14893]BBJ51654.1 SpdA protein [Streptomyces avermitilis]